MALRHVRRLGLAEAVRVRALMHGKPSVGAEDVRALARSMCWDTGLPWIIEQNSMVYLFGRLIDDVLKQENL